LLRLAALTAVLVTAPFAFMAASAAAAPPAEFGSEGPGAGQLGEHPRSIAVDQQTGDVYVADTANNRVDRFSESGVFQLAFGWGVRDGASELQVCGPQAPLPSSTCVAGIGGAGAGQLAGPRGVAVDNDPSSPSRGDVYMQDNGNSRIVKFGAAGEFLFAFGEEGTGPGQFSGLSANSTTVDFTGDVYVADNGRVQRFGPGGALEAEIPIPGLSETLGLAVDSAGDLYLYSGGLEGVHKYDASGLELGTPRDPGPAGFGSTITLGPADQLIVTDGPRGRILTYDPSGTQLTARPLPGLAGQGSAESAIAYSEPATTLYLLYQGPSRILTTTLPEPGVPFILPGSERATEVGTTSATLNATANPEGGEETTYHFEYGTEAGIYPQHTAVEPLGSGEGFEDILASKTVSGLATRTTYHWRIVLTDKAGETVEGADQTFTTLPPVSIDATSASEVSATAATLEAELNPHGLLTNYHFEYDTAPYTEGGPAHGTGTPTASVGSGTTDVSRSAPIEGLTPDTVYHYRVVATNSLGTVTGPDRSFTTQGILAALLPDSRAYELVSPPDKHGSPLEAITAEGGDIQASADGSALAYISNGPVDAGAEGNRSSDSFQLLARREGPGLWSTTGLGTANQSPAGHHAGHNSEYQLFSTDLSSAALEPLGTTPLSPATSSPTPYLRANFTTAGNCSGSCYRPLVTGCPEVGPCPPAVQELANVPPGTKFGESGSHQTTVNFVTGTPDLGHLLFSSRASLVAGFESVGQEEIYEWSEGSLVPVSVLPEGAPAGRSFVGNTGFQVRDAVSADGSRVVFAADSHSALYLRVNATAHQSTSGACDEAGRACTIQLDAKETGCSTCGSGGGVYQDASTDGRRIFFTDGRDLTAGATATNQAPDLYMCEVEEPQAGHLACALTDLTVNSIDSAEPAGVLGDVSGTAADGSSAYFVANGALTEDEGTVHGNCAEPSTGVHTGECNLYRYDLRTHTVRLIAVLAGQDFRDWEAGVGGQNLGLLTARVSPDGRYLAFMSSRSLTGYDNRDAVSGARDQEVYLYDSQGAPGRRLLCASCNPSGARPHGVFDPGVFPGLLTDRPEIWGGQTLAANIPGWTRVGLSVSLYQSRYLSDSGRLFFNAADSLVPQDTNGVMDVYQFEFPQGPGQPESDDCTTASPTYSPASGGCVNLISSGTSAEESAFLDASESGNDVFFLTASRLSPRDEDKALDVYDARVGGGEPSIVKPVECSGDACQQPAVPPTHPTPGTLLVNGPENVKQCPKGNVKKNGKCVKKHKAKKKNHNKKSHKKNKTSKRTASHKGGGGK